MDTDRLPNDQAETLRELIQKARFFDLPAVVAASTLGADRFQYNVTIEDNGQRHSVQIHDSETLPESLKPLLKLLTEISRAHRRP